MSAVEQLYAGDIGEIVIDLPFPPSTNHIWRRTGRRVFRAAKYIRWLENADMAVLACKQYPRQKLHGPFSAHILLNISAGHGDADNRIKAVLDWCVSRAIVDDDMHCRKLTVEWAAATRAPAGCRVTLRSLPDA